ncbi:MAG: ubiquinol-cytochrome c reductase cytochrome b subunit [Candidatus Tokpelaia sp. JSC085]|nr:MAG: ubiquinol-cytochrome c reductase cytochrome b subunit [Candidatus Tokpelaia sp. JSC085]
MIKEKGTYRPKTRCSRFLNHRLPFPRLIHDSIIKYYVPKNLNYFYTFGCILILMLTSQILTGIVMAMHYVPDVGSAFESREHFMRSGRYGWLFGPWHAVGSSFFFIAVYIHLARSLYYGSHKSPREIVWILGVFIYLTMMATAFIGHVLAWSMISAAEVSIAAGLFRAMPLVGSWLYETLLGGYSIGQPTLNRFYVVHSLLPFVLVFLIVLHIWAVHMVGQNNPTGLDVQSERETIPFVPYAAIKYVFTISIFLIFFAWFLFYMPDYMSHADHHIQADIFRTPQHVVPEWYFLPFYTMLRAITFDVGPLESTLFGVMVLTGSLLILLFVPWLDRSQVRSARFRPLYRICYWLFIVDVIFLGWLGSQSVNDVDVIWSQIGTAFYFIFFLIIMPYLPRFEKNWLPASIEEVIHQKK